MHTGDGEIPRERRVSLWWRRRSSPAGGNCRGGGCSPEQGKRERAGRERGMAVRSMGGAQIKVNKLRLLAADDWEEWKRTGEL
jgi:hypothetical protein